jgi:hypothetical protein
LGIHDIDDVVHGYGSEGDDNDDNNSTSNGNAAANDTGAYDEDNDGYDEEGTTLYICIYMYTRSIYITVYGATCDVGTIGVSLVDDSSSTRMLP